VRSMKQKLSKIDKEGKGDRIPFAAKKAAKNGVISCILDAVSLGLFIAAVVISFYEQGQGGRLVGGLGVLSFLVAAAGCVYGFLGFREEDRKYGVCTVGSVAGGIIMVFEVFLCFSGM
jgi:hypothetical protein